MIKTSYNVTVKIDDEEYKIVVADLNKAQKLKFETKQKEVASKYEKRDAVATKLQRIREEYSLNDEILKGLEDPKERTPLLLEQKTVFKTISDLQDDLEKESQGLDNANTIVEEVYKERFDVSVSGEGRDALLKVIEEKGISYQALFFAIGEEVAEQQKKK